MLWAGFYADANALGVHWIYDTKEIEQASLNLLTCNAPLTEYHASKQAGDFTHYGDQMLWLLESLSIEKEFNLVAFANRWLGYMDTYKGYVDSASKHTYEALQENKNYLTCGSSSSDFSVIGRMIPLIYINQNALLHLQEDIKLHTIFTHMNKELVEASAFFLELIMQINSGVRIEKALESIIAHYSDTLQKRVLLAQKSLHLDSITAIKELGQSCSVKGAFSSTLHILLKHTDNFDEALKANLRAGGDSAARAMVIAPVMALILDEKLNLERRIKELTQYKHISQLIKLIDEHPKD